jgi:osmoprotectant transport system permease protein
VDQGAGGGMSAFGDAVVYLNDPYNWTRPNGILDLAVQHLTIAGLSVGIALVLALPPAVWLGHTGRGGGMTVAISNVSRAVPTLAVLTIFAVTPLAFTIWAPVIALTLFAIPPILANTYVGLREVDRDVVEAARGMGLSTRQVIGRVELPLALPLVMTGIRTAAVQVVATATLAALLAGGTLGAIIRSGFGTQNYGVVVAGAILVAALALLTELVLSVVSWALTPRGSRRALPWTRRRAAPAPVGEQVDTQRELIDSPF